MTSLHLIRRSFAGAMVLVAALLGSWPCALAADEPHASPERYVLNYPATKGFCPPVRSYFEDVTQAIQDVGDHSVRHQLNGGYGLPVILKERSQNLIHLGADVAFHRRGEPVFAIASGVVRASEGPAVNQPDGKPPDKAKPVAKPVGSQWGNLIVIEHCLPDGSYVTSIYGHLAHNRLVAVGDVVEAGQMIGTVGKSGIENGGYTPHLHFGVREGRMAEPGAELFAAVVNGQKAAIRLVELDENEIQVEADKAIPIPFTLRLADQDFTVVRRDGKCRLPAAALYYLKRPDFQIVGYGLRTEGWRDPTEFLSQMRADTQPVAFGLPPMAQKKAGRTTPTQTEPKAAPTAKSKPAKVRPQAD